MKTIKITFSSAILALFIAASVFSCKKKEVEEAPVTSVDTDVSSASDNNLVDRTASDITNIGAQIAENPSSPSVRSISCASISRDTTNKIFTVTFNGQVCNDGHVRSGSLTFDYSGSTSNSVYYRHPGFKLVISANNYIVDGYSVTIHHKSITNTTNPAFDSSTTNLTWSIIDSITVVKPSNAGTIKWYSNRINELVNTSDTNVYHGRNQIISWDKAIVGMTGNATGITAQNETFTANITSQLQVDFNCAPNTSVPAHHPLIKGTLEFTPGTRATRVINYSYPNNGACDDSVSVSINGRVMYRTIN